VLHIYIYIYDISRLRVNTVLYLDHKVDFEHYSILNAETSNSTRNETDYKNYVFRM